MLNPASPALGRSQDIGEHLPGAIRDALEAEGGNRCLARLAEPLPEIRILKNLRDGSGNL